MASSLLGRMGACGAALAIWALACGGGTIGDLDGSAGNDGGGNDGASTDGAKTDGSSKDGGANDAGGNCTPPGTACPPNGCPQGTVCLKREQGPGTVDLGCTPLHPSCNGVASCNCMAQCFCFSPNMCTAGSGVPALFCSSGAISRREYKDDIEYVEEAERLQLARETLDIPLATYRYKSETGGHKRHLGFIIDDQPASSPAVQADRTHVDEYGYTSMLLATVQEQQRQIDALTKKVEALEKPSCR